MAVGRQGSDLPADLNTPTLIERADVSESHSMDPRLLAKRARKLKWYHENKDRANKPARQRREENPERQKELAKAEYEKHKARRRARALANPEKVAARRKAYRESLGPEVRKARARAAYLKYTFGMSVADYEALLQAQGGRCAICGTTDPSPKSCLVVDHDHTTGKIRQLLCHACNCGIGHFREDPALLEAALAYLRRHLTSGAAPVVRKRRVYERLS